MKYMNSLPEGAKPATEGQIKTVRGMAARASKAGIISKGHARNIFAASSAKYQVSLQEARHEISRLSAMIRRSAVAAQA